MGRLLGVLALAVLCAGGSASAQTLYAATGSNGVNGQLFTINASTGAVISTIGNITLSGGGIPITGLAFHPSNGTLYGVTSANGNSARSLVTINPATGAATLIGSVGGLGGPVTDISFDSTGVLYGMRGGGDSSDVLGTINLSTGVFTAIGSPISASGGGALAFAGGTLYASINGSSGALRTYNKSTGVSVAGPNLTGAPQANGALNAMAANNAGTLFATNTDRGGVATVSLVTINTSTGAISNLGRLPNDTDAIAFQTVNSVPPGTPVPTTALLMVVGMACLGLYRIGARRFV